MATLRIVLEPDGKQIGARFKAASKRNARAVIDAARAASREVADEIQSRGRDDISRGIRATARWLDAWTARQSEGGGFFRITVSMAVPYWRIFQYGGVIEGRPLLWIPLSFAADAKGVLARNYPGMLFRVDRKVGAPLLMTPPGEAKYFGKESVTMPKKFHLIELVKESARKLGDRYRRHFRRLRG